MAHFGPFVVSLRAMSKGKNSRSANGSFCEGDGVEEELRASERDLFTLTSEQRSVVRGDRGREILSGLPVGPAAGTRMARRASVLAADCDWVFR